MTVDQPLRYQSGLKPPKAELTELLVGKSVVAVDIEEKLILLSDGTELTIEPNVGICCENGEFSLIALQASENIITSVKLKDRVDEKRPSSQQDVYELFVYAEGVRHAQKLVEVAGYEGNGYYGSGFKIHVAAPQD